MKSSSKAIADWNALLFIEEALQRVICPLMKWTAFSVVSRREMLDPCDIRSRLSINAPRLEILISLTLDPPIRLTHFKVGMSEASTRGAVLQPPAFFCAKSSSICRVVCFIILPIFHL